MSAQRVVIVGGGFAGLSAAYTLQKRGITPLVLEALDRAGGRGKGEEVDGFSLDMGAFVFTSTYDTAFGLCEELGLPLVRSQMKFGHFRNGRWVTTTPEQSLWNFVRHVRTAVAMGFGSPAGFRAGSRVMRQMHRQEDYLSFASDSPLAEIDDDETYGDYLKRLGVPRSLQLTLGGPLKMVLGDPEPAGQALMRAYIGETMLSSGTVYMPERGIGSFNAALAAACSDAIRVSTPVRQDRRRGRGGDWRGHRRRDHRGGRGHLRRARHTGPGSRSGTARRHSPGPRYGQLFDRLPGGDRARPLRRSLRAGMVRSTRTTTTPRCCWTAPPSCRAARPPATAFSTC